ncbi:MAG TPA: NADH-quinone oxidoreductase subunit J [Cytophagaceae bacterium]
MELVKIAFYFFAALTVVSAFFILYTRHVLHAAFSLLATFLGVAGLYVLAGADYLALTQIVVYVGGVLVLIIFGIMLSKKIVGEANEASGSRNLFTAGVLFIALLLIFFYLYKNSGILESPWIMEAAQSDEVIKSSTVSAIGKNLMTNYILPFELAAVILLVALIGAAFIAGRVMRNTDKS